MNLHELGLELDALPRPLVYMCFSTSIIHGGHIAILKKAQQLGTLVVGVLSDEAIASCKYYPIVPFEERKKLFENLNGIYRVVEQDTWSYRDVICQLKPDFIVHGDDWQQGFQQPLRAEVLELLAQPGTPGKLIEFPYSHDEKYAELDNFFLRQSALPDMRRAKLRKLLALKPCLTAIEVHNGITGLIAEQTKVFSEEPNQPKTIAQFDAMWVSSLCDSTAKGKPDIELVDMTSRFNTITEITEVTTKPIIFDGDTGGLNEHFVYTVRSLERMGVSMVIIEDKVGLKKNSLFGTEVKQEQDSIEHFCDKIRAGKKAQRTRDFMICARIESLILEQGVDDALARAQAYVAVGADAIMIHARKHDPAELFEFTDRFRELNHQTPLVAVPTAYSQVTEQELQQHGINIVIYANHLMRAGIPAMQQAAASILKHHRALEAEPLCMPFRDIITMIPEE